MRKVIITEEQLKLLKEDYLLTDKLNEIFPLLPPKYSKENIAGCLGEGGFGSAFLLKDGTVLKITRSYYEFEFAKNIVGKKLKHIANVYDAFYVSNDSILDDDEDGYVYAINLERVDRNSNPVLIGRYDKLYEFIKTELNTTNLNYYLVYNKRKELYNVLKNSNGDLESKNMLCDLFVQLCATIDEIKKVYPRYIVAQFGDYHSGNMGFDKNGVLKFFDQQ